jgi:DNA repair exonuclease SbcCD ATPase subunit
MNAHKKKETKEKADQIKKRYSSEKEAGQKYLDELKADIVHLKSKQGKEKTIQEKLSKLRGQIEEAEVIRTALGKQQEIVDGFMENKARMNEQLNSIMNRINELRGTEVEVGGVCSQCHATITEKTIKNINDRIDEFKAKYKATKELILEQDGKLKIAKVEEERLEKELVKFSSIEAKKATLMAELDTLAEDRQRISEKKKNFQKHQDELKQKLAEIQVEYKAIQETYKVYKNYKLECLEDNEAKLITLEDQERSLSKQLEVLRYKAGEYDKAIKALGELKKSIEKDEDEKSKALFWKIMFPKLKVKVISETIPMVQSMMNHFLSDLIPSVKILLTTDVSKVNNKIDLDIVYANGVKRQYEGWNGGAQLQMDTAAFLALNTLASKRSGKSLDFLIMDEKFASVDAEARAMVLELLRELYKGRKLYAISHVENIEAEFGQHIRVKSDNYVSSIESISRMNHVIN